MNALRFKQLFQVLLVLLSFSEFNSQNMNEVTPICYDNGTVTYSLYGNVTNYLENNNNIDKRNFFNRPSDLKDKKIGVLPGFPINKDDYPNVIIYPTTEDLVKALKNHSIDGVIADKSTNDYIVLHNYDLYRIPENVGNCKNGIFFQKNDQKFLDLFNNYCRNTSIPNMIETWTGINYDAQKVDKNVNGNNGTIKARVYLGNRPIAYKDENGEATGACLDIIYSFAKSVGYGVEFQEASSYDDSIEAIKQGNADISCGYVNDSLKEEVNIEEYTPEVSSNAVIRLSNSATSNENPEIYETYKDLDGKKLGVLTDSVFKGLTEQNFSKSEYQNYNDSYQLYKALFTGEIEGFLTDLPSAEDFKRRFPEKVDHFEENFYTNLYGFAFQKNNSGLESEFNDFLRTLNLTELYPKWNVRDTSNLTVDKTLPSNPIKTIRVAMFPDTKPICFEQNNEIIGYEVYIIYEFARYKSYNIEFITLENSGDRINYLLENKTDISAGALTITDERREDVSFSYPILSAGTSLVVSRENKQNPGKIQALDENYNVKPNNTIFFPVKVGDVDTISACVFPENYPYNGYALINCTISDLKGVDPTKNGLKLENSNDTLGLNNVEYNPTNLLNGNTLLPGRNIIAESNKTDYICYVAPPTIPTTVPSVTTVATTTIAVKNSSLIYYKSSKKGLSTGAIIGIIIPCAVALLAATIGAFMCRRGNGVVAPAYAQRLDTSNYKLNVVPQYPMQQYQVHQVPVQQVVQVQEVIPVQKVVPVTKIVPAQVVTDPTTVIVNNP